MSCLCRSSVQFNEKYNCKIFCLWFCVSRVLNVNKVIMASRRTYRCSRIVQNQDYSTLNISDVLCPICRSIFIEPVTLPCNHSFCNCCFEATVENANLVCPLCRIRIGSWMRRAKKDSRLINEPLWQSVKSTFPEQVKNRLNGIDEDLEQGLFKTRLVCNLR